MRFSTTAVVIAPLAASLAGAMPTQAGKRQGQDDCAISDAIFAWQADTQAVSNFLSSATGIQDPTAFTAAAQSALDSEKDELIHKAVLDGVLQDVPDVQMANHTLVDLNAFGFVVDSLQAMVNEGPATAAERVFQINQDRCVSVLPNIDVYFAAAAALIDLSPAPTSVRPNNCGESDPGSTPSARRL